MMFLCVKTHFCVQLATEHNSGRKLTLNQNGWWYFKIIILTYPYLSLSDFLKWLFHSILTHPFTTAQFLAVYAIFIW